MPRARYEGGVGNGSLSHRQRSELYVCMMKSTTVIDCKIGATKERRGGGVILNEQGLVLTSLKLVQGASLISVTLFDMVTTYEATIAFDNVDLDLALIQISGLEGGQQLMYAEISSQILDRGQEVISIGGSSTLPPFQCSYSHAGGLVTNLIRNALDRSILCEVYSFLGMICMVGSPVYDSSGNIVALQWIGASSYAVALPGARLLEFYSAYLKNQENSE